MPVLFLKLTISGNEFVPGDALDQGFEKQIVLDSCNWSATAEHKPTTANEVRTTVTPAHLKMAKTFDRSSAPLYGHMKLRKQFASAEITMVDASLVGGKLVKMLSMTVEKCYLESIATRTGDDKGGIKVAENLVLSFESGKLSYFPQNPSAPGRLSPVNYDLPKIKSGGK